MVASVAHVTLSEVTCFHLFLSYEGEYAKIMLHHRQLATSFYVIGQQPATCEVYIQDHPNDLFLLDLLT